MKLKHIPTGLTGYFVKEIPSQEFKPWITWVIKLDDGREYFAPKNEFTIITGDYPRGFSNGEKIW